MKRNIHRTIMLLMLATALAFPLAGQSSQAQDQGSADKFRKAAKPGRDRYIVVLKNDTRGQDVESIANELATTHRGNRKHIYTRAIKGFSVELPEAAAMALSRDPRVEYVQEDGQVTFGTTQFSPPWGIDRIDQRSLPRNFGYYYPNVNTGAGVHAYVVDSGIQMGHQQFLASSGGTRVANDVDLVNDGRNGADCNGHGTFVAGVIGGSTVGVAKGVRLHNVRVGGCDNWMWTSTVIAGIDWVTNHHIDPAVVNLSLGGGIDYGLEDAVRGSIADGITYVAAAGNDNVDAKDTSPARVGEAITVGASNADDDRAGFSNFGPSLDLFAPGVGIVSASHLDLNGNGILDDAVTQSGTSAAAPHVTGVAARFLQTQPDASPAVVQGAITNSSSAIAMSNPGAGSPTRLLYSEIHTKMTQETNVTVNESDSSSVYSGIELRPREWAAYTATGEIWSGVVFAGNNGPQGWNDITHNPYFPLPLSRPFSLLGTFNGVSQFFYLGLSNATTADSADYYRGLYLRINDDMPGNGSGSFNTRVQVFKHLPDAGADYMYQSVPATMSAGETRSVSVTMKNTGTATWAAGESYRLGSQNPQDNTTWGIGRAEMPYSVTPGSQVTLTFNITAPSTPGTYNFQWRMLQEGVQWFGDITDNAPITVLGNLNNAEFVSQSVPRTMYTNESYDVSITMRNIGNTTWQAGTAYRLGSQSPQDNTRWGLNRVVLPHSVAPGATVTFNFVVTAPPISAAFAFQWRMVQDGVEWFGAYTPVVSVSVRKSCSWC
jgi:hypothetical protein